MNPLCPRPITRRLATDSDLPFLLALRRESMGPHYSAAGIPQFSADQEAKVRWHFECTEIVESPGGRVGMLKVLRAQQAWRLIQIQLLALHRGTGIGRYLLDVVIKEAKAKCVSLALSVLKVSAAKRLYERAGFVVISENENVFHMRRMD